MDWADRVAAFASRQEGLITADGAQFHDQPEALFRDRSRQNALISADYAVIRFMWEDTLSAVRLPGMVRAAMRR